jgi:hypothetical protein
MTAKFEAQLRAEEARQQALKDRLKLASGVQRKALMADIKQSSIKIAWLQMRVRCIKWGVR